MSRLFKVFFTRQFFIFLIVGVINTANCIIFSFLFSLLFKVNISFILGYLISLIISYLLNSYFAFQSKLSFKKLLKFSVSYVPNFVIQNLTVLLVFNYLRFDKLVAFALAAIIGIPITFLLMKFFAFAKKIK